MLRPQFLLTNKIPLTVSRQSAGSYVRGVWVEGTTTEVEVEVNIQPVKPHEVQMMPESDRTREWYKVYCADELRTKQEGANGHGPDRFEWQGHTYEIMKVQNYSMSILDHWKAWAARVSVTPK